MKLKLRDYIEQRSDSNQNLYLAQVDLRNGLSPLLTDLPIDQWLPQFSNCEKKLWFSFTNRVTPLHFDREHNLFLQFRGRKHFTFFAPEQRLLLYPTTLERQTHFGQVDVIDPDLEKFPNFAKSRAQQVDLEAGDALILPMYWWHHVQSYGESLGVSVWWRAGN